MCLLKWRSEKISVENVEFATEEFEFATEYWINLRHFRFLVIAVLNDPPQKRSGNKIEQIDKRR